MFMSILRGVLFGGVMAVVSRVLGDGVPPDCSQLIVAVAPDWNSMRGKLQLFERPRGGGWTAITSAVPVLFGKNGLAWGSGMAGQDEPGLHKKERDGRAPAGVLENGKGFGYDAKLAPGGDYTHRQATPADRRGHDPRSANDHPHLVIGTKNSPHNDTH